MIPYKHTTIQMPYGLAWDIKKTLENTNSQYSALKEYDINDSLLEVAPVLVISSSYGKLLATQIYNEFNVPHKYENVVGGTLHMVAGYRIVNYCNEQGIEFRVTNDTHFYPYIIKYTDDGNISIRHQGEIHTSYENQILSKELDKLSMEVLPTKELSLQVIEFLKYYFMDFLTDLENMLPSENLYFDVNRNIITSSKYKYQIQCQKLIDGFTVKINKWAHTATLCDDLYKGLDKIGKAEALSIVFSNFKKLLTPQ